LPARFAGGVLVSAALKFVARIPTDVELAFKKIHDARKALTEAENAVSEIDVDQVITRARAWLDRERHKPAGLTASEIAVVERLIDDLEAGA